MHVELWHSLFCGLILLRFRFRRGLSLLIVSHGFLCEIVISKPIIVFSQTSAGVIDDSRSVLNSHLCNLGSFYLILWHIGNLEHLVRVAQVSANRFYFLLDLAYVLAHEQLLLHQVVDGQ